MKLRLTIQRKYMQPIEVDAFAPTERSLIATMRPLDGRGYPSTDLGWGLVHVPTGMRLTGKRFSTRKAALDFLGRCDPEAECWCGAIGKGDDPATKQCWEKFNAAATTSAG